MGKFEELMQNKVKEGDGYPENLRQGGSCKVSDLLSVT